MKRWLGGGKLGEGAFFLGTRGLVGVVFGELGSVFGVVVLG